MGRPLKPQLVGLWDKGFIGVAVGVDGNERLFHGGENRS
jgi:hypothetical protein